MAAPAVLVAAVSNSDPILPCPCGYKYPPTIKRSGRRRAADLALRCPSCGLTALPAMGFFERIRRWNDKVRAVSGNRIAQ